MQHKNVTLLWFGKYSFIIDLASRGVHYMEMVVLFLKVIMGVSSFSAKASTLCVKVHAIPTVE